MFEMIEPHHQRIILARGLPASGKSTWAMGQAGNADHVRISRDDIRHHGFNKLVCTSEEEAIITEMETAAVRAALRMGHNVVVDAMHLQQRYINRWQRLGYPVEIREFHAPLDVLLERNAQRERQVPESVIRKNFERFTNKDGSLRKVSLKPEQYISSAFPSYHEFRDSTKPEAYIFDVDGTLAFNDGHRSFYDYTKVYGDLVKPEVAAVANDLGNSHHIIIVTGRKAEALAETERWLIDNAIYFDVIHARDDGDERPDAIVKYEILRDRIAPHYDVLGVFDDRPSVCEMWRNVDIPTFQVGDPDVRF